jgi:hypothetical protein
VSRADLTGFDPSIHANAVDLAMQIELAIEQMKLQSVKLDALDLGYPLGANVVRPANRPNGVPESFLSMSGAQWLVSLYSL